MMGDGRSFGEGYNDADLGPASSEEPKRVSDWKAIKIAGKAGRIVGMTQFQGMVLIAAEYGCFRYHPETNTLHRIEFEEVSA